MLLAKNGHCVYLSLKSHRQKPLRTRKLFKRVKLDAQKGYLMDTWRPVMVNVIRSLGPKIHQWEITGEWAGHRSISPQLQIEALHGGVSINNERMLNSLLAAPALIDKHVPFLLICLQGLWCPSPKMTGNSILRWSNSNSKTFNQKCPQTFTKSMRCSCEDLCWVASHDRWAKTGA